MCQHFLPNVQQWLRNEDKNLEDNATLSEEQLQKATQSPASQWTNVLIVKVVTGDSILKKQDIGISVLNSYSIVGIFIQLYLHLLRYFEQF